MLGQPGQNPRGGPAVQKDEPMTNDILIAQAARPFAVRVMVCVTDQYERPVGTETYTLPNRYETYGCAALFADRTERYVDLGWTIVVDAEGRRVVAPAEPVAVSDEDMPF